MSRNFINNCEDDYLFNQEFNLSRPTNMGLGINNNSP